MLRRILIGQYEDVVLEIVQRMFRRFLIGRDEDVVLEIVRRMLRRMLRRMISKTSSLSQPIRILRSILWTISKTTSSSRPIRILQRILRKIFKSTSLSRPIRFFRTNPQENQVTRMVTDHTSDEIQKSRLSTTRHSNDLRSHERDGRKQRKKSPRAKAVRLCTH